MATATTPVLRHLLASVLFFVALTYFVYDKPAFAQETAPQTSVSELQTLVKSIENEDERAKLLSQLKALLAAQEQNPKDTPSVGIGSRFVIAIAARAKALGEHLTSAASSINKLPGLYNSFLAEVSHTETRQQWFQLIYKLFIIVGGGYVVFMITRMLLARPKRAIEDKEVDSTWVRFPLLFVRTILDLLPVMAFVGTAQLILPLTEPLETSRAIISSLLSRYLLAGVIIALARMVLTPNVHALRMLPITDVTSNYLFVWVRRLTYTSIYGFFIAEIAGILGADGAAFALIDGIVGLLLLSMSMMFVLQNRNIFAQFLKGETTDDDATGLRILRKRFADIWHALAIIYLIAGYTVWIMHIEGGFIFMFRATVLTVLILIISRILTLAVKRAVAKGFSLRSDLKERYPSLEQRANNYLPVLQRIFKWLIYLVAGLAILSAWGVDVLTWLNGPIGRRFSSSAISIALILVVALIIWEGVSTAIERYLVQSDNSAEASAKRARARTLLPLLRNAIYIMLLVMVVLLVLSELGVNIGPLLAGAGVAGIAIGFGSQKLVQDVITGAFILFEDSMAVGDVVTVAATTGVVEQISIRSIRLRDLSGNVHTIPFSVVDDVTNMTKDFSYYVFEIGIGYRESVDDVIEVIKDLGAEFEEDVNFGPLIMAPLEVLGLDQMADSAIIIKARYKTVPIKQWAVGREFNRRIKNRFDELGIEIPFPHQTIYFGEDKEGDAPPLHIQEVKERTLKKSPDQAAPIKKKPAPDDQVVTPTSEGQVSGDSDGE